MKNTLSIFHKCYPPANRLWKWLRKGRLDFYHIRASGWTYASRRPRAVYCRPISR